MNKTVTKQAQEQPKPLTPSGTLGFIVGLSILCLVLHFLPFTELAEYQREKIQQQQWWRLVTGNLLHTNTYHLVMNIAGLWVIYLLHSMHYQIKGLMLLFAGLLFGEGLGLFWFYPDLLAYVGLSGVLHGLLAFGSVQDCLAGIKQGYLLLAGIVAKVVFEQTYGATQSLEALISARVSTESHLVGLATGLIFAVLWTCVKTIKSR